MKKKISYFHGFLLKVVLWTQTGWRYSLKVAIQVLVKSLIKHLNAFWFVWGIFFLLSVVGCAYRYIPALEQSSEVWNIVKCIMYVGIAFLALQFLRRPMSVVYGLMGTSGSIHVFFANFVLITLLFACIYHWGFFYNAQVSYDINQPHVCFNYNADNRNDRRDTTYYVRTVNHVEQRDTVVQLIRYHYQPISFGQTWRNTILTTLMQEPTDFFAIASTYNASMDREGMCLDQDKAATFHWLLIIQILISWIFFGVFISILYNKFRYES